MTPRAGVRKHGAAVGVALGGAVFLVGLLNLDSSSAGTLPSPQRCATSAQLEVPALRHEAERCGPAALAMVLQYYDAPATALREADTAYDPVLRGSLITELAAAARRAGFRAVVATLTADSLIGLLQDGVPPIMLYQNGNGPMTVRHFGVVTRWDGARSTFALHDGSEKPRELGRAELIRRWSRAGSQALIVTRSVP